MSEEILSKRCLAIKKRQAENKDLTETQCDFCCEINEVLEDYWYLMSQGEKKILSKFFVDPYLGQLLEALKVVRQGFSALDSLVEHAAG